MQELADDIAALRRGELDLQALKTRVGEKLRKSPSREDAMDILQTLYESRKAGDLPDEEYEELTQFVGETIAPMTPASQPQDNSFTQLAADNSHGDSSEATEVEVGMRLRDRFILDEVIGAGGMGTVYRGRDQLKLEARDRDPHVAIKVLNETFKKRPEAFIALQREASRQQRLAHPNIATVYDFDRSGGIVFITMEFLTGRTLDQFIKEDVVPNNGLPMDRVLHILDGICAALSYAHERNIVHADFKPGNCFITEGDSVKVLDFGIARAVKDPGAPVGDHTLFDPRSIGALTPAYASYEMLSDTADADARDDIYALGCVTYELLAGRHPFHRIPADQAKANDLKPDRIDKITRKQNEALRRALAFDRVDRTPSVKQFFEEMTSTGRGRQVQLPWVLGTAAVALVLAGLVLVPSFMEQREYARVVEMLTSADRDQVRAGLEALSTMDPSQEIRARQENRQVLLNYFRAEMNRLIGVPDEVLDYQAADGILAEAQGYFPDSAVLAELASTYEQRKNAYLSDLAQNFESYLTADRLIPTDQGDDLPGLLFRIATVDPSNPLLSDTRVPGAYLDAAEQAINDEDYVLARQLVDEGVVVAPSYAGLTDVNDRLVIMEQAVAYQQQVAGAADQLRQRVAATTTLDALNGLQAPIAELQSLDLAHPTLAESGAILAERFSSGIDRVAQAVALAEVRDFLEVYETTWTDLGREDVIDRIVARRDALQAQQSVLVSQARDAMRGVDLTAADGKTVNDILTILIGIDPTDSRITTLRAETVNQIRTRALALADANAFDEAREELAKAERYADDDGLRAIVAAEHQYIDGLEASNIERVAADQRRANEEQVAELARLAQEQRIAQRQAVDAAAGQLQAALAEFSASDIAGSVRTVQARQRELARLDPDNAALSVVSSSLERSVIQAIEQQSDLERAFALVRAGESELGTFPELSRVKSDLERRRSAQSAAVLAQRVSAASSALDESLQGNRLSTRNGRQAAAVALGDLLDLVGRQSAQARSALDEFAQAHVRAATPLIESQRFSAAGAILDAAARQAPQNQVIDRAQGRLQVGLEAYRSARMEEEKLAKLAALRDRFNNEINATQLDRARDTLGEYRRLEATDDFVRNRAVDALVAAYQRRVELLITRGELTNATALIEEGKSLRPTDAGWAPLNGQIQNARLKLRVAAWFQGNSQRPVGTITQYMATLEGDPDYSDLATEWSRLARARLARLDNLTEHNRFLIDVQSLLPGDRALASLEPKVAARPPAQPVVPSLARADAMPVSERNDEPVPATPNLQSIAGVWCGDNIKLDFSNDAMAFTVGNQRLSYPVVSYGYNENLVTVKWRNRRVDMVFEFGDFSSDGAMMKQLRGRRADGGDWQTYNRSLERCR